MEELQHTHPRLTWLDYLSIKQNIPAAWIRILNENSAAKQINIKRICLQPGCKVAKTVYNFINDGDRLQEVWHRWNKKVNIDASEISDAFKRINKITNIAKLRNFQFRLLHNKVFCNNVLFHWKKVDSKLCNLCQTKIQTPLHLLYECKHAREIWKEISEFFDEWGLVIDINAKSVILNNAHPNPTHVANFYMLTAKQYIFRCKCENVIPTTTQLAVEIENLRKIELFNSQINDNVDKYVAKWCILQNS